MPGKIYDRGCLTAMDGYVTPIRFGSYVLDTFYNPLGGMLHNHLAVIKDAISNRDSYIGGTLEPDETLLQALVGECAEEGGLEYDPMIVSKKVIAILSLDTENRLDRRNDLTMVFDPDDKVFRVAEINEDYVHGESPPKTLLRPAKDMTETYKIGAPFKLRNIFRTKSTVPPVQQPARQGEIRPEAVNPHYELLTPFMAEYRFLRPSFCTAIKIAEKIDILYSLRGRKEVEPDWNDLAMQWEDYNIHPAMIDILCKRQSSLVQALEEYNKVSEKIGLGPNAIIDGLMHNLDLAYHGLHDILRHRLPHDPEIREILRIMKM